MLSASLRTRSACNVVVTFSSLVTAKAWALSEVAPAAGKMVNFVTAAGGTGQTNRNAKRDNQLNHEQRLGRWG
jgi:hypothetical protein